MRSHVSFMAAWIFSLLFGSSSLRADHVIVRLGDILIPMEGKVADPKARIVIVTHEKFKKKEDGTDLKLNLYYRNKSEQLSIEDMIIVPSRKAQFEKLFAKAQKGGSDEKMESATWAIKHGMLPEFYKAIELVLQADPDNAAARAALALRDNLAEPLVESDAEQKQLTEMLGAGMKYKRSPHYILAYDTQDNRAQERLDLLERVYETFFMYFAMKGRILEKPAQRLMVVLFDDHKNYLDFSLRLDPELKQAAGYWSPESNVAVFFNQGTYEAYERLNKLSEELDKARKEAERQKLPNRGDLVRLTDTVKLLKLVEQENQDVEVVSHEATHQIAGNNGLFPRRVRIPRWAQEGLAAFFESPKDASWTGVGAINQTRIDFYRVLADHDRVHSNIDFVVSDEIYSRAASHAAVLHAYGQAWGLTHFLMDKHFNELSDYWRNLARLPADMVISEPDLRRCFEAAFGKDHNALDQEWRRHMGSLQTDTDKLRKEYGERLRG